MSAVIGPGSVGIIHGVQETVNVAQEGFCPFLSFSCYPDL